jgi:gamma-glutamyl phosphate reductase
MTRKEKRFIRKLGNNLASAKNLLTDIEELKASSRETSQTLTTLVERNELTDQRLAAMTADVSSIRNMLDGIAGGIESLAKTAETLETILEDSRK